MRVLFALLLCLSLPAQAVEVLASIRPLAQIAAAVVDEADTVRQLVPVGASSHHYQLRPSDRLALARADLVLWVGPAHERFLQKALAGHPRLLTAQKISGMGLKLQRRAHGDSAVPGTVDAHLWLEPDNAVLIARALAEALAARAPARAEIYRRNAAAFATRLAALKAQQATRFQNVASRSFAAYHDAYQYLEPMLGLNYRGSLMAAAESKPGAKHFLLMSQRIRQEGVFCFLGEPGFDQALAKNVFNGRPVNLVEVDELFSKAELNKDGYEAGLLQMVDAVYRCLGGK